MQLCQVDSIMVYTGNAIIEPCADGVIPRGYIYAAPPKSSGVWQWGGNKWLLLEKYPAPQPPTEKVPSTKEEYQKVATDAGYWDALIAIIDERIALKADPKEPIKP